MLCYHKPHAQTKRWNSAGFVFKVRLETTGGVYKTIASLIRVINTAMAKQSLRHRPFIGGIRWVDKNILYHAFEAVDSLTLLFVIVYIYLTIQTTSST